MRKTIIALTVAAGLAAPAAASATPVTVQAARWWSHLIRTRTRFVGDTFVRATLKCVGDGSGGYNCWGTYTIVVRGVHYREGEYVDIYSNGWMHALGHPQLLARW